MDKGGYSQRWIGNKWWGLPRVDKENPNVNIINLKNVDNSKRVVGQIGKGYSAKFWPCDPTSPLSLCAVSTQGGGNRFEPSLLALHRKLCVNCRAQIILPQCVLPILKEDEAVI